MQTQKLHQCRQLIHRSPNYNSQKEAAPNGHQLTTTVGFPEPLTAAEIEIIRAIQNKVIYFTWDPTRDSLCVADWMHLHWLVSIGRFRRKHGFSSGPLESWPRRRAAIFHFAMRPPHVEEAKEAERDDGASEPTVVVSADSANSNRSTSQSIAAICKSWYIRLIRYRSYF
jgi:hypothetical protein